MLASVNGYNSSMVNGLQSLPPWMAFMNEPAGAWLGFISIAYWIGLLLAYTITPSISSRFGRKPGLYIGVVLIITSTILQGLSPNPAAWIIGRGLAGCAASFWSCNAPVLITKIAFPSH
jgi:MFS family permease